MQPIMTRRRFTQTTLLGSAALGLPAPLRAETPPRLTAKTGWAQLAPEGYPATAIWGYDGAVPGPELRLPQGARLSRRFLNELPQASTIHWHGIRIENAMDGVAGLTQDPVEPQTEFLYDFELPDAGTYWYHPHNRTFEQMARGLYGALIVEEPEGAPDTDADLVLLLDDWRFNEDASLAEGFGNMHDMSHAGRIGNWITVNGDGNWTRKVARHTRLRLRLVNTSNARIFTLESQGLEGWVIALDGMPLETPAPLARLTLAPAQRADLIVDITADAGGEALLVSQERDGGYALAAFPVDGTARAGRLPAPAPLPENPVPPLGPLEDARRVSFTMEGGAMGRMQSATHKGHQMNMRGLVGEGMAWALGGTAGMPDAPLLEAGRGETIRIAMTNDTAWPHAMHLHGHHFRQIRPDGTTGPLRDTLLMNRGDTAEIAFAADNPGDWLLHCHMLEHAASGMMTWLRVT